MSIVLGCAVGFVAWFLVRYLGTGVFTVDQNERAVKTRFGRAERVGEATTIDDPIADDLRPEEKKRYCYPQVRVIPPGGPYFKWPWEKVYRVSIATQTVSMAHDPEDPTANQGGRVLEAVTKDQLNTGLTGQIRYRISEKNLYAYLFGVKRPFSQPVNSEEGAPMGIGIWYEMFTSDPVAYLFKNADPRGSLAANVSNATVRCLSNLKLADMLENRHAMSQTVRAEVSPKSHEWGYKLGSVYIRKVHFRDTGMIKQIEEKVVNRLRQVTSAIKQDGANQVSIITSTAERQAAVEFAKARAMRPRIVGAALQRIAQDSEIAQAMFEVLETDKIIEGDADIVMVGAQTGLVAEFLAARESPGARPEREKN